MMQQQRCPHGFGFIMVVFGSLACRSRKNFLLRSVFFLNAKQQLRQTEARVLEPEITSTPQTANAHTHTLHSTFIIVTSQSWDTSAGPHCNRYELPVQHSFHTLVYGRRTGGNKVKHTGGLKKSTNVGVLQSLHDDDKVYLQHTASLAHMTIVNSKVHKITKVSSIKRGSLQEERHDLVNTIWLRRIWAKHQLFSPQQSWHMTCMIVLIWLLLWTITQINLSLSDPSPIG